jgi:hypothetical protein
VQFAGDPVAFGQDGQFPAALVQARVDQGDGGMRRYHAKQFLVVLGEPAGCVLVGEEDLAEDLVPVQDRHAEKVGHLRVRRRPPAELGMGTDVGQAYRMRILQQHTEQPVLAGQRADRPPLLVADPVGHELGERTVVVRYPERGVPGIEQPAGRRDDGLQHLPDRQARGDGEHRGAHLAQLVPVRTGHIRTVPRPGRAAVRPGAYDQ